MNIEICSPLSRIRCPIRFFRDSVPLRSLGTVESVILCVYGDGAKTIFIVNGESAKRNLLFSENSKKRTWRMRGIHICLLYVK
jgi:hypothetical protein